MSVWQHGRADNAFVVMAAYRIVKELSIRRQHLNLTVEEGIKGTRYFVCQ